MFWDEQYSVRQGDSPTERQKTERRMTLHQMTQHRMTVYQMTKQWMTEHRMTECPIGPNIENDMIFYTIKYRNIIYSY